jgi:hypothetical protein
LKLQVSCEGGPSDESGECSKATCLIEILADRWTLRRSLQKKWAGICQPVALSISAASGRLSPGAAHSHAGEPTESAVGWAVAEPGALLPFYFPAEALVHF